MFSKAAQCMILIIIYYFLVLKPLLRSYRNIKENRNLDSISKLDFLAIRLLVICTTMAFLAVLVIILVA
jgi:hypothetical protein